MIMYVYMKHSAGIWAVGFYDFNGDWHTESAHTSPESAAQRVAWLNGSSRTWEEFKREGTVLDK